MKIIRFKKDNQIFLGTLNDDFVSVYKGENDLNEVIKKGKTYEILSLNSKDYKLNDVKLLSPLQNPLQDIICLGINYLAHAEESYKYKGIAFDGKREEAVYFAKRVNEFKNPNDTLELSHKTPKLDYECELAFILKKDAKNLNDSDNFDDYILGYTILNDISARDLQNKHKQWYMGKSLEHSCPFGSFINTSLNIQKASNLKIECFINDELRQSSNTNLLIFDIPYILKELSSYTTLKAGTIISTGTPSGVGMGFNPPKFLQSGDKIECKIETLGSLINYIK